MATPVQVNTHLVDYRRDTYTTPGRPLPGGARPLLDCALGTNPYGAPPVAPHLPGHGAGLSAYRAPDAAFRDAIAAHWAESAALTRENIQVEAGTFGVIERLNKLLVQPGTQVLGYVPQFSDFAQDVIQRGATFDAVPLRAEDTYRFSAPDLIDRLCRHHRLVYLDNPNNPTGQIIPLPEIEKVVAAARELRVAVLVDEAYGDFMAPRNSAVTLVPDYDNLFVARSFSKGWGLAGLRVGYAVMSPALLPAWQKISHPFPVGALGLALARQALGFTDFLQTCVRRVRIGKRHVLGACRRMSVPATAETVPILTLIHPDEKLDLRKEFLNRNVLTTPGHHFAGLGPNAVRIRLPRETDALTEAIQDIENAENGVR